MAQVDDYSALLTKFLGAQGVATRHAMELKRLQATLFYAIGVVNDPEIVKNIEAVFVGRSVQMFTKNHYDALAGIIRSTRAKIDAQHNDDRDEMRVAMHNEAHRTISEIQLAMIQHFKADNKKFKELLFIKACSNHEPE